MKYSAVTIFLLLALLSPLVMFFPFGTAEAANVGVYIQGDGTVQGTSSILRNGNLYTFVGNIAGPLYVEKDNVVIDGAGYTVTGANGRGIVLAQRHGVTLKDARVTLDGGYIIDVESAADCVLIGNTLVGTPGPMLGPYAINFLHSQNLTVKDNSITNFSVGLSLEWSSGHTITGNTLTDGIVGIDITNTTDCLFRNNHLNNCGFSIRIYPMYQYENDLDPSNTVNGNPIYYWVNVVDRTVPSDAAYIVMVNCAKIKVENTSPQGISFVSTTNSTITNVKMTGRGDGISLLDSSDINIVDNILRDNAIGVEIDGSSNNTISGNDISNHQTRAIDLNNASNNVISGNTITNNSYAIAPFQDTPSNMNVIASNNFTNNGFAIIVNNGMKILDNVFEDNDFGLMFSGNSGATITQNTFTNNKIALDFSGSSGNSIYLNNFLKNDHQVVDAGVNSSSTQPTKAGSDSIGSLQLLAAPVDGVNFFPPPPPSINQYDNGAKGNYWIDYNGSDKNGDGIGDTAYFLYENNQDNYPLMKPVSISGATVPVDLPSSTPTPTGQSPENSTQPGNTQVSKGTVGPELPIAFAAIAIIVVIGASLVYLKKRKS